MQQDVRRIVCGSIDILKYSPSRDRKALWQGVRDNNQVLRQVYGCKDGDVQRAMQASQAR